MSGKTKEVGTREIVGGASPGPERATRATIFLLIEGLPSLGIALTIFAIELWVLQTSGSYATFATLALFAALPGVLLSPLVGPVIDRIPRGLVLSWCDYLGIAIGGLAAVYAQTEGFSVRAAALALIGLAVIQTVRWPTLLSTVSALAPPGQIGRVTAYEESIEAAVAVLAPLAGAFVLSRYGISVAFVMATLAFGISLVGVLLLRLPLQLGFAAFRSLLSAYAANFRDDFTFGFRWIKQRPQMLRLLIYVCIFNFGATIFVTMQTPVALALFAANDVAKVLACGGAGLFAGGAAVSLTGGIQPVVRAIYLGSTCIALSIGIYGLSGSMVQSIVGAFAFTFFHPFVNTAMQVMWRSTAPLEKQGAIFSVRRMFTSALGPAAIILSVPISNYVAAPALRQAHALFGSSAEPAASAALGATLVLVAVVMLLAILLFQAFRFLEGESQ